MMTIKWDKQKRKYWDIELRPSKDKSQKLLELLLLCDGKIHDMYSLDVGQGEFRYNLKISQVYVLCRISIPVDAEDCFRKLAGDKIQLLEIPKISLN